MSSDVVSKLEFIGLDTDYPTASGQRMRRTHLDGAASPLPCKVALDTVNKLLPHYSNTHSYVHSSAQISTRALAWSHTQVLNYIGASQETYASIFSGSGTTAAINRVARGLHAARPDKPVVLVSSMEHHANDLPHRQFGNEVHYLPLTGSSTQMGAVDLEATNTLLEQHRGRVNYLAVSSVSNVTGIRNPITELAALAHKHEAFIVVDGAQSVAHTPTELDASAVDFFIFSGHKVYTPASPGVLIAKKSVLAQMGGQDLGGGSVSMVSYFDYQLLAKYPDREQSGTPNIVGAVALASVLRAINEVDIEAIRATEKNNLSLLFNELNALENITIYGDHLLSRTGALAFNHRFIDHGLLAAILNDYYAIAVRNECFCAHPYVSNLLKEELWELDLSGVPEDQQEGFINRKRGMVRASVSAYNTEADIIALISAIKEIETRIDTLATQYSPKTDGSYIHKKFKLDWRQELGL